VKYRGQKIGERLIRQVLEDTFALDGIEQIELSAVANNQGAIRLYEKLGFKTYGIQPGYFKVEDGYTDQAFMYLIKEDYQK
jgi:ribosomal protein S18 acetylase RimI-like enzyme